MKRKARDSFPPSNANATGNMGIPNKRSTRSGLSGHSSGSHPEIFQMTQDEFADHVTWDAEKPRLIVTENYLEDSPPHAQFKTSDKDTDGSRHTSTDGGEGEGENNSNLSFSWKDVEQQKQLKRRNSRNKDQVHPSPSVPLLASILGMQQSDANQYTRVAQSPVQKITNFDDLDTNIINDRKRKRTEDESNTVKEKQVDDLDELIYSLGEREDSVEAPPVDANSVPTDLLLPQQDDSNETVPIVITKQPTPVPIVVVGAAAAAAAKEVVSNPVTSIDDDDFALSEEELRRIDEQVNQVLMSQLPQQPPQVHFRPEVTVPKVTTSMPAPPPRPSNSTQLPLSQSLSQHIDQVLVSDEDLAFFEELERQALAQYPTNHGQAVPPVPVHSTIVNKPSNSTSSSSVYSSVNRSDSNNNLPLVVKRNFCIRLIVKEVLDGPAGSKVIRAIDFKAAQSTGTASSSSTIPTPACSNTSRTYVVHLCDDWFDTNVEVGDIIHIVDIDDPALLSSSNSTNSNNNGIVKSSSDQEIVIVINKLSGIIVVCPDIMISPTKIAEACSCVRRGVLSDRIRSLGMSAPSAILGNVRHSFIEKLSERVLGILLQYPQQDVKGKYQKALMERYVVSQLPQQEMDMMIEKCVQPFIEELYCMQANDDFIRKELYNMIAPVVEWMTLATLHSTMQLVQQNAAHESMQYPPTSSSSNTSTNSSTWKKKISDLKMRDIVGIEESIVSPVVGIKGQLDMISAGSTYPNPQGTGLVMLPIEFKTGKWRPSTSIAHRAQVILYILLMMLRQRSPAHSLFQHSHQSQEEEEVAYYGVILYLNESEVKVDYISPQWYEMIALIRSRNQLAKHIHQCNQAVVLAQKKSNPTTSDSAEESIILTAYSNNLQAIPNRLPPVLQSINECSFCYSAAECMMYHAAIEDGTEATSGVSALYHYVLRGLTSRHVKYLRYWDRLIDLEAMSSKDVAPFAQYGFEREGMRSSNSNSNSSGGNGVRCLSGLIMDSNAINSNNIANAKNEKVDIIFRRSKKYLEKFTVSDSTNGISKIAFVDLDCSGFMVGDRVMLSIEYLKDINLGMAGYTSIGHEALTNIYANLCSGSITSIGSDFMEVSVAMGARSIINLIRNQSKSHHVSLLNQPIDVFLESQDCYLRLDRDDHNVNISTMRSNLMELFVEAFDPKLFQEINRPQRLQRQASNSSTSSNDAMISNANFTAERNFRAGMLRQRVRELLVDLRPPQFQAIPSVFHTELAGIQQQRRNQPSQGLKLSETDYDMIFHLCAPPLMGKAVYHQALLTLLNYRASNAVIHPNNPTSSTVNTTPIPGQYFISPSGLTIYPGCHPLALYHEFLSLNIAQQQAILKVLSCLDYVLLWGLPGTGKTYTLCVLIRILIARGETVLLTSYTHNAVDHILSMLYDRGVGQHIALRLHGSSSNSQIPATIVGTALVEADTPNIGSCKSIAQYTERLLHVRLFVSTILTVSRHVLYKSHRIMTSYCIIDEAGQITTPVILAGFLHAQKYVLAGDDYQLPPLVINQDAVQAGMDISLLKQLMTKEDVLDKNTTSGSVAVASTTGVSQVSQVYEHSNHDAITTLFIQYRMNSAIMSLSNTLIYQGKMQCGNEQVANQLISLPGLDLSLPHPTLPSIHPMSASGLSGNRSDWLYQALHPNRPVVFLNNDGLINSTNTSYTVENLVDAKLIYQLLYGFEAAKLPINTEVSVISPFRAQVSLMQQMIKASNRSSHPLLREYEASTVDKYQGKDKDIIIFNTVRTLGTPSNEATSKANGLEQQVGMLLKDWRRINVALTRAKSKLIIVGSATLFQQEPLLLQLYNHLQANNWIVNLTPDAIKMYSIDTPDLTVTTPSFPPISTITESVNLVPNQPPAKKIKIQYDESKDAFGMTVPVVIGHQPPVYKPLVPVVPTNPYSSNSQSVSSSSASHSFAKPLPVAAKPQNYPAPHNAYQPQSVPNPYNKYPPPQNQPIQQQSYPPPINVTHTNKPAAVSNVPPKSYPAQTQASATIPNPYVNKNLPASSMPPPNHPYNQSRPVVNAAYIPPVQQPFKSSGSNANVGNPYNSTVAAVPPKPSVPVQHPYGNLPQYSNQSMPNSNTTNMQGPASHGGTTATGALHPAYGTQMQSVKGWTGTAVPNPYQQAPRPSPMSSNGAPDNTTAIAPPVQQTNVPSIPNPYQARINASQQQPPALTTVAQGQPYRPPNSSSTYKPIQPFNPYAKPANK